MSGGMMALCTAMLLWFSSAAMEAAREAAQVFATGVLPALFPMLVLDGLSGAKTEHSIKRAWLSTISFAFAAGSPASSRRAARLMEAGAIPKSARWALLGATGVMSPMFFVGTLASWTGSEQAGWLMLVAHWLSALMVGAALYRRGGEEAVVREDAPAAHTGIAQMLPSAIAGAARSLLSVCGAMMLFGIAAGLLRAAAESLLPAWLHANERPFAVLHALLEVGGGSAAVLRAWQQPPYALLCALCSFGGLSIWLQNLLFVGKSIRPARLLVVRAAHGAVSYAICALLLRLMPCF